MEPVSIILPTYNRANVLGNAIQSILNQTYTDYELLIVDDGSTDNTEQIVEQFQDSRIRYIALPENKGVSAARNIGIREAKYDYIAFQDSDDYWKKEKLEKQMHFLTNNSQIALLYCSYQCIREDGTSHIVPTENLPLTEKQGDIYKYMLCRNTIGAPTVLLRKDCLSKVGLFREALSALEDWELFTRIAQNFIIGFQPEPMVLVNLSSNGVSHNLAGFFDAKCYMAAKHKQALLQYNLFSRVTKDIFEKAKSAGILTQVSQILQYYLQYENSLE